MIAHLWRLSVVVALVLAWPVAVLAQSGATYTFDAGTDDFANYSGSGASCSWQDGRLIVGDTVQDGTCTGPLIVSGYYLTIAYDIFDYGYGVSGQVRFKQGNTVVQTVNINAAGTGLGFTIGEPFNRVEFYFNRKTGVDNVVIDNLYVPPTATPTNTPIPPTATNTPVPTNTSVPPTATTAATNTPGPTATNTPIPPPTDTPPPGSTNTPIPTNTPVPPTDTPVPGPTNTPFPTPDYGPTSTPITPIPSPTLGPTSTPVTPIPSPTVGPTSTPITPSPTPDYFGPAPAFPTPNGVDVGDWNLEAADPLPAIAVAADFLAPVVMPVAFAGVGAMSLYAVKRVMGG